MKEFDLGHICSIKMKQFDPGMVYWKNGKVGNFASEMSWEPHSFGFEMV